MIQRIQTIYLLIAAILMAVTAFSPLFVVGPQVVNAMAIVEAGEVIKPTWGIVSVSVLTSIISLLAIFMFKNRKLQVKFANITIVLGFFFYVTTLVYMLSYYDNFFGILSSISYGIILPLCAIIFMFLAKGRIGKDEKLVRSLDRIR